jgi:gluconolactonase
MDAGMADAEPEAGAQSATDAASGAEPGDAATDATAEMQGPNDAAGDLRDAAAPTDAARLRAEVCGDGQSFPAPLPAMDQRSAQPVGNDASFGFLEGPVWLADQGVLLFSDMDFSGGDAEGPPSRIRRLTPPATFDVFNPASNSNGLALSSEGNLLSATHDNQGLSRFDARSATRTPLNVLAMGKRLNSPNDLTVRSDGAVFFTDPDWQLGPRTNETGITGVYRVDPPLQAGGTSSAVLVEGTLAKPNGIALSPDEQTLYVGSSGNEIWKYRVQPDGSLDSRTKFAETGASDGMTVDCAGNLYVASGTIEVFAPSGEPLGQIMVAGDPTNVAFGGADRKTLYITAGPRLYAIKLNVPGYPY